MHLRSLSDEEIIAIVRTNLSATEIERELARRLAEAANEIEYLEEQCGKDEDE